MVYNYKNNQKNFRSETLTLFDKRNIDSVALLHFLSYPLPRVRVRASVKLSPTFFHDESSITKGGGYESPIAPTLLDSDYFSLEIKAR